MTYFLGYAKDHKGNLVSEADIGDMFQYHKYGVKHYHAGKDGPYRSGEKLLLVNTRPPEYIDGRLVRGFAYIFLRLRTNTKVFWRPARILYLKKVLALSQEVK